MIEPITVLGLVAACITTASFLPQVLKLWRTKSAGDVSVSTFGMISLGVSTWLVYGLILGDLPIILANGSTLIMSLSVVILARRYRRLEHTPVQR